MANLHNSMEILYQATKPFACFVYLNPGKQAL